jgi:AcrR family transcriptional regulator
VKEEKTSAEARLIDAAVHCIEIYGVQGATTQRIAERAGVNNASVNYYFRNKDKLIQKALTVTLKNAFDWEDFRESDDYPPRERLVYILTMLMRNSHKYPGLSRAHFSETVMRRDYDTPSIRRLNEFLGELEEDLVSRGITPTGPELKMALVQIVGTTFLQGMLSPGLFREYSAIDLTNEEVGEEYVRRLVVRLLP